jgi:hypothetical protein
MGTYMHMLKRIKRDFNKMPLKTTSLVVIGAFLFIGLALLRSSGICFTGGASERQAWGQTKGTAVLTAVWTARPLSPSQRSLAEGEGESRVALEDLFGNEGNDPRSTVNGPRSVDCGLSTADDLLRPRAVAERQLFFTDQRILNAIKSLQERNEPVTQTAIAAEAKVSQSTITRRKKANPTVAKAIQEAVALSTTREPASIEKITITFTRSLIKARACLEQAKRLHKEGWHQLAIDKCRTAIALARRELKNEFPATVKIAAETIQEAEEQVDACAIEIAQAQEKMALLPLDYLKEEISGIRERLKNKSLTPNTIKRIKEMLKLRCRVLTDDLLESTNLDVASIELLANKLLMRIEEFIDELKDKLQLQNRKLTTELERSI